MKKEIFRFLYRRPDGHDDHFNLPIFYNSESELEANVHSSGEDYMQFNTLDGRLYEAHSTERDLVYRFRKMKEFWYRAVFMRPTRDGLYERFSVRKRFVAENPLIINDRLRREFEIEGSRDGWEMVSLGLDESSEIKSAEASDKEASTESIPQEKWVRVADDRGIFSWVPGLLYEDGRVKTLFGLMSDPDSPDDLRDFTDCPFEGFTITKNK